MITIELRLNLFDIFKSKEEQIINEMKFYETFKINIHGLPFTIEKIEVDNEAIDISKINGVVTFEVTKEFREIYITGTNK